MDVCMCEWNAALGGSVEDVEELLTKHKVDPNKADNLGNTAMHYAAGAGHARVVLALLRSPNVAVSVTNHVLDTPLHKV